MSSRSTLGPALIVLLAGVSATHRASACSPPPTGIQVSFGESVPIGGALLLHTQCYAECEGELQFVVRDADGREVPGAIVEQAKYAEGESGGFGAWYYGWLIWQPSEPFSLGTYAVEYPESVRLTDTPPTSFEVTSSPSPKPTLMTPSVYGWVRLTGPTLCCAEGLIDSCGGESCYTVAEKADLVMNLSLRWEDGAPAYSTSQFLYRARVKGASDWSVWSPAPSANLEFTRQAEYCYAVESWNVGTDEKSVLFEECFAEPSDQEVPDPEGQMAANAKQLFTQCTVPPEGYEELWCENLAGERAKPDGSCAFENTPCSASAEACPFLPDGSGGSQGTGGSKGETGGDTSEAGGSKGETGGGKGEIGGGKGETGGQGGDSDPIPGSGGRGSDTRGPIEIPEEKVRGCSTAPGPQNSSALGLVLAAMSLALFAARARRVPSKMR